MKRLQAALAGLFLIGTATAQTATVTIDMLPVQPNAIYARDGEDASLSAKPGPDGKYVFTFSKKFPQAVSFSVDSPKKGQLHLFVSAGDRLNVKTDFGDNTTITGKGAGDATVRQQYMKAFLEAYEKFDAKGMTASEYYEKGSAVYQIPLDRLEASKGKISPAMYREEKFSLELQKISMQILMPYYFSLGFQKKLSETIPEEYWQLNRQVNINDKLLTNHTYKRFMTGSFPIWLRYRELKQQGRLDSALSQEAKQELDHGLIEKYYTGEVLKIAMFSRLKSAMEGAKDVKKLQPSIDRYMARYGTPEDKKEIDAIFKKLNSLAAGQKPPYFKLKSLEGKDVALQDFAGKVVYVDFWASWCSPCRQEMRNGSPKLHEQFKDNKEIVFLYISIDDSEDKWKKAIDEDKIEGVHLLSAGGTNSVVAKAFNISGIPRYMIIGKDGKIADNDATRPSQAATAVTLNKLLAGAAM